MKTILVSIGCLEDQDIFKTTEDMWSSAKHPDRLRIVVILQTNTPELFRLPRYVQTHSFPRSWATGCGKPRAEVFKHYAGEDYFFQTDSHMRFEKHWDQILIDELEACPSDRPILTTLPPNFVIATGQRSAPGAFHLRQYGFFEHIPVTCGFPLPRNYTTPPQCGYLAGGVLFSRGVICQELKYDPYMYFHGEEHSTNIRLWTMGYDNFAPRHPFCYHAYRAGQGPEYKASQTIYIPRDSDREWHLRSLARVQVLTGCKDASQFPAHYLENLDQYGLGTKRTVRQWEDKFFVNLKAQTFRDPHLLG